MNPLRIDNASKASEIIIIYFIHIAENNTRFSKNVKVISSYDYRIRRK